MKNPKGFILYDAYGPLRAGEIERAKEWGAERSWCGRASAKKTAGRSGTNGTAGRADSLTSGRWSPVPRTFLTWSAAQASCGGRVLDARWRVHPQWVSLAGASASTMSCGRAHTRGPERKDRRMGCLLALLAGFAPRVALALVWIFTNLVDRAFNGFLIPLLGLIVFPYATLFYVLAYSPVSGGVGGWGWIFVVLGFVFDIGHWVGGGVTGRQRYASA
jgi:hypothetical protein